MSISMSTKFIVLKNNRELPLNTTPQKIINILQHIECGWCYTCMEKFFIYKRHFENHKGHNLLFVNIHYSDNITRLCWITQKYPNLLYIREWKKILKKYSLTPIYKH